MAGSPQAQTGRTWDPAWIAAPTAALVAVAVFHATLLPGVGSWDTAEAQVVPPLLGTMHPTGSPAYAILGWLASLVLRPLGSPAYVMNLLSALLAGVAVGASVLVFRRLGAPLAIAVAVAIAFGLSPLLWSIGTAADVHALHVALTVLVVLGLLLWQARVGERNAHPGDERRRRSADRVLVLTAALFGVALANHALVVLLVPAIAVFVRAVDPGALRRPRLVAATLGACIAVAMILYLELPLRAGPLRAELVYGHPDTIIGFLEVVLAGQFRGDLLSPLNDGLGRLGTFVSLALSQFGPLLVLVPVGLVVTWRRRRPYALLSILAAGITSVFAVSYANAGIERYYVVPELFAWSWIAVLATAVVDRVARRRDAGRLAAPADGAAATDRAPSRRRWWPPPRAAAALVVGALLLAPTAVQLGARWSVADRSQDTRMDAWLDDTFSTLEPDAVVISWWSYSTPLWYGQLIEQRRPDIRIVDDRTRLDEGLGSVRDVIEANLGTRPVYVIRSTAAEVFALTDHYAIEPVGRPDNLYHVTGRTETAP